MAVPVLMAVILLVLALFTPESDIQEPAEEPGEENDMAVVVDTHSDTLLKITDNTNWLPMVDIGRETPFHIDIPKLMRGGVNVQYFGAFTSGYYSSGRPDYAKANSRLLSLFNALYWTIEKNTASIGLATTVEDIKYLVEDDRISAVLSIEGAYSIEETCGIELLRQYYDLGVRAVGLTWNYSNALGEGVNEAYMDGLPSDGGLTEFGRQVVKTMNSLGIIIDVSHMNERTFWDVIEVSDAPVMASHSGVYSLRNHARNLKDDQIRAVAECGGVVQVVFYPEFLADPDTEVTVKTVVDHIEYIAKLVGVEYVGIGSDFDGAAMPEGLQDASMVPEIEKELSRRGYEIGDIEKILGNNTMRVMKEAWNNAGEKINGGPEFSITPMLEMGQGFSGSTPVLEAVIKANRNQPIDRAGIRVIVDGRVYSPRYHAKTGLVTLQIEEPLREKFHVVTFEAAGQKGYTARETRIFHIQR